MQRILAFIFLVFPLLLVGQAPPRTLFVYGGQVNQQFIRYTAQLTGKARPKICFLPTATGDRDGYIAFFYELCSGLSVDPYVLRAFTSSSRQNESWEATLTHMDAIIVGGGNTLNMLAIWRAQGIDLALRKAYAQGVVLAGGSAGSLCWFTGGTTDSRPIELTIVEGLGYLPYSHCPHYHSEASRKPLYHENIRTGKLTAGYACDDNAGLVFKNEILQNGVATDTSSHAYFVQLQKGEIVEERIEAELIE
ncbi:MAG: peptidase E [Bacteroidota bacterium]